MKKIHALGFAGLVLVLLGLVSIAYYQYSQKDDQPVVAKIDPTLFERKAIREESELYTINVVYPDTRYDVLNRYVLDYVNEQIDLLKQYAVESRGFIEDSGNLYFLDIGYEEFSYGDRLKSIVLETNTYTGGAHGNQDITTFVYDTQKKQLITLLDMLIDEDFLPSIAAEAYDQIKNSHEELDLDWLSDGIAPNAENYERFSVSNDFLRIYFPPYFVAPYAYGTQTVEIPITEAVKKFVKDYR